MAELFVVGLGPGDAAYLTGEAAAALERAEVLCGYSVYVELIAPQYPGREIVTTTMKHEVERCRSALELASTGRT
ncbi:MAG: precorrin-3B C(17)-methyltransferase, partial [Oscillospiraceae bacterium]|nr:precorrin-3B C(17)-methyltransferase [Oscillospiraceae bacterium]